MNKIILAATVALLSTSAFAADAVKAQLKDGTNIEIAADAVSVIAADGAKTPAPDGTHELADGTKVTTKEGKVVKH